MQKLKHIKKEKKIPSKLKYFVTIFKLTKVYNEVEYLIYKTIYKSTVINLCFFFFFYKYLPMLKYQRSYYYLNIFNLKSSTETVL